MITKAYDNKSINGGRGLFNVPGVIVDEVVYKEVPEEKDTRVTVGVEVNLNAIMENNGSRTTAAGALSVTDHETGAVGRTEVPMGVVNQLREFFSSNTDSEPQPIGHEASREEELSDEEGQHDAGPNQGAPGGNAAGGDDGGSGSDSLNAYGLERLESEYGHLSALGKLDTIKQKRLILTGKACSKLLSECAEDGVKISLATWRYIAEGSTEDKSIHIMGATYVRERGGIVKEIRTDTLKQGRGVIGDTVANTMHRYEGSTLKNVVEGVNRRAGQAMDIVAGNTVGGRLINVAGELAGEGAQQVGEAVLEGLGVDPIDATNATQAALGIVALGRIKVVKPKLGKSSGAVKLTLERKVNIGRTESPIWKGFKSDKGDIKTNGKTGNKKEFYQWDNTHNDIEVYNSNKKHLGSMDPSTGKIYKPAVKGRRLND